MKFEEETTEEGMFLTPDGQAGSYQRGTSKLTISLKDLVLHPRRSWRVLKAVRMLTKASRNGEL
jgi:hypothetical protein